MRREGKPVKARDEASAANQSRPAIIALSIFTLRFITNWRIALRAVSAEELDIESILIVVSVTAIGAEKFTRGGLESQLNDLAEAMPEGRLAKCNLSSIANATGVHREKVRRKVNHLECIGVLEREPNGAIRVRAAVAARPEVKRLIIAQNEALRRLLDHTELFKRS